MIKKSYLNIINWQEIPYFVLFIGLIIFIIGSINYYISYFNNKHKTDNIAAFKTSLIERDIAIADAIKNGKKEYSYETSFTPGVGRIINPDAYKDQWQKNAEQSINEQNIQTQGSQNPLSWQEKLQQGLNKYIQ